MLIAHATLGFLIGGAWIAGATIAGERFGGRLGGFIAGLPSTIVVAYIFLGLSGGREALEGVSLSLPLTFSLNALFLYAYWRLTAKAGEAEAQSGGNTGRALWLLTLALLPWLAGEWLLTLFPVPSFLISLAIGLVVIFVAILFSARAGHQGKKGRALEANAQTILTRSLLGGSVVAGVVLVTRWSGPLLGSIVASFPAVFFSTLLLMQGRHGPALARTLVPSMMISGLVNVNLYNLVMRLLLEVTSHQVAVFAALGLSAAIGWALYVYTPIYGKPRPGSPD